MNWTQKELKNSAKLKMRGNYWKVVFISLAMLILSEVTTYRIILEANEEFPEVIKSIIDNVKSRSLDVKMVMVLIVLSVSFLLLSTIARLAVSVFLKNPMEIGAARFMLKTTDAKTDEEQGMVSDLLYAFDYGYMNSVKTLFLREVSIFLRTLLLLVPGIIRMYDLRLLPYLLANDSSMTAKEAISVSKEMMKGQRWKAFLLDLSFIPWHLLGILTLGVGEIFYVLPFYDLTNANLYRALRDIYIEKQIANE